jgi:mono/diheme cytochrome c family protein
MARRAVIPLLAVVALAAAGCGSQQFDLDAGESQNIQNGAQLFSEHCSGCHSLDAVDAEGSAKNPRDKETTDGPNFNDRREDVDGVLYAIRNGGFSGAIMPENIVTGQDAQDVADFLAKYAGRNAPENANASDAGNTGGK